MTVWWCRCPEVVQDDRGKLHPCRAIARVVHLDDDQSTSGPVLRAHVRCDAGHDLHELFEDLELLG